jgi:hypothetical protein
LKAAKVPRSRFLAQVFHFARCTTFIYNFFFLEVVYPHHRVVLKRATVEDPERVLHLSPDATGVCETGRLA